LLRCTMETHSASPNSPGQKTSATQKFSHHVSVPSGEGLRVDKTTLIERPVSQVYCFWNRFENLPQFMRHVQSVTVRDDRHSHWTVRTVGKKLVEWDAEIIERRENELISWRSMPGADVDNAGSVRFAPAKNGMGTELRVSLKYIPTAGKAGVLAARLLGRDADAEIEEDLSRLKSLLETGQLPPEPTTQRWQRRAVHATRKAAERVDVYVRQNARRNPWAYVASVVAVGAVIGLVMARFRGRSRTYRIESDCR
jgi:uncharacterized membrane protein